MDLNDAMLDDSEKPGSSAYHALLLEYAAGALDEACSLIVATHLALSPEGRKIVQDCESVGGSMLHRHCKPVAMKKDALQCVMAKIDAEEKGSNGGKKGETVPKDGCHDYNALPTCVKEYLCKSCKHLPWKEAGQGLYTLTVRTCCSRSKASLWKFAPDTVMDNYTPQAREIRLILRGRYFDGVAAHEKGALFILEESQSHTMRADADQGCLCLIVRRSPQGKGFWQKLMSALRGKG